MQNRDDFIILSSRSVTVRVTRCVPHCIPHFSFVLSSLFPCTPVGRVCLTDVNGGGAEERTGKLKPLHHLLPKSRG